MVGSVHIWLSEKFLSFYEIIDAQCFLFYIILSNYVRFILFCWDKHRDISQTWFHVCTKVHCCIRSSEKFLSFYKEIREAQYFPFYIILLRQKNLLIILNENWS